MDIEYYYSNNFWLFGIGWAPDDYAHGWAEGRMMLQLSFWRYNLVVRFN